MRKYGILVIMKIELSMRQLIVDKLEEGKSQMHVAKELNLGKSTVQSIWKKYIDTGSVKDRVRSGRPRKTTEHERRILCRESKKNPFYCAARLKNEVKFKEEISVVTVRRILCNEGIFGRIAARKPLLNVTQIKKRLKWCKDYNKWSINEWRKIIFSDECKFEIFSNRRKIVRRPIGTKFKSRYVSKSIKYGKFSLMVWGAIKGDGSKLLIKCPHRLDSAGYQSVLDGGLSDICGGDSIFMQDGASCHTSDSTMKYLDGKSVCLLSDWPPQSPDLNIIENLWAILKDRVVNRFPSTKEDLWNIILDEWNKIDKEIITRLYDSIPRRIQMIIKNKGSGIKY